MELNIFFFHAISTKEKMMSIFMWCKKTWLLIYLQDRWNTSDLEKNLNLEGFIAFGGGRYQCPGRYSHLLCPVSSAILIHFLTPILVSSSNVFKIVLHIHCLHLYIVYNFFCSYDFVSIFFGAFLIIEKLNIICKEKKIFFLFFLV